MSRPPFPPWDLPDDALPMVLVVLDGLGDRPCDALGGRTPAEAAHTPVLDQLAAGGVCGVHVPFGLGRATSSERAHWAMFGYTDVPFPGRAALELAGVGGAVPVDTPLWHLALRAGELRDGATWIVGRGRDQDEADQAERILREGALAAEYEGMRFKLLPLRTAEWILVAEGAASAEVSDSDPLFEHLHPWMLPAALSEAVKAGGHRAAQASRSSAALVSMLSRARLDLRSAGLTHSVPATKWASVLPEAGVPPFEEVVGVPGAMVPTSALYRGLARLLRMLDITSDAGLDSSVAAAHAAVTERDGPAFVHVHTKDTDEAGHTKDPEHKVAVIERIDAELAGLLELREHAVVAVTGDHATPSVTSLLHSGDPTPLVIAGPDVRADGVLTFGEQACQSGQLGAMRAVDLLPALAGLARRPAFLGHRPGATATLLQPCRPTPMPDPGY